MFDLLQSRAAEGPVTFGEPGSGSTFASTMFRASQAAASLTDPLARAQIGLDVVRNRDAYGELFRTAERQQRLVDNVFAETRAQEEVYDRWIKQARETANIELENPLRGGYAQEARRQIRDEVRGGGMTSIDGSGGVPERQLRIFNDRVAEVRAAHPDLQIGDVAGEARGVAREAEHEAQQAGKADVNPLLGLGAQFAGGLWAGRRDPIFMGSLFAGPTSAIGKAALTRVATSGLFQGAFNAGVSALEQPAVQEWRREVGLRSGVLPAVENVGLAFLFGLIPGAAIRGVQEEMARIARPAALRMIEGRPRDGDVETVARSLDDMLDDDTRATMRAGDEMQRADAAITERPAAGVTPEQHDSLNAAALRQADDPLNQPSPEAVAHFDQQEAAPPAQARQEIETRVAAEQPQTRREAEMIASEVIEEHSTRAEAVRTREELDRPALPPAPEPEPVTGRSRDPLEKVPWIRDDGTPTTLTRKQLAAVSERDDNFALLVRSCK